jgi:hypothetical protein
VPRLDQSLTDRKAQVARPRRNGARAAAHVIAQDVKRFAFQSKRPV